MVDGYITQERKLPESVTHPIRSFRDPYGVQRQSYVLHGVIDDTSSIVPRQKTTSFRTNVSQEQQSSLITGHDQLRFLLGGVEANKDRNKADNGHTFYTECSAAIPTRDQHFYSATADAGFDGPILLYSNTNPPDQLPLPSFDETTFGNRLVAAASPNLPRATLATGIAELAREGFSHVIGSGLLDSLAFRTDFFRSLGKEYLNLQFGWAPFLRDLKSVIQSVSDANKIIFDAQRSSGLVTRRKRHLPIMEDFDSVNVTDFSISCGGQALTWPELYHNFDNAAGVGTRIRSAKQHVWFSGAFTFQLAIGDSLVSRFERYEQYANILLGTRITPSVLWALTPWSWLVDWVVDISSALRRAELLNSDGNVMKYGYMMRQTVQDVSYSGTISFRNNIPRHYGTIYRRLTKERFRATPFGFGLNPNDFDVRQWAILAALGLTRGPRSLF
jgi:hypothetical protein